MFGNFRVKIFSWSRSHEQLLLLVLRTKVSPLGPVNRPCAAGIAVEPFWPRSAVLRLHIRRLYNVLLFIVKNISCDKFSWFEQPRKYFNNENFPNYGIFTYSIEAGQLGGCRRRGKSP